MGKISSLAYKGEYATYRKANIFAQKEAMTIEIEKGYTTTNGVAFTMEWDKLPDFLSECRRAAEVFFPEIKKFPIMYPVEVDGVLIPVGVLKEEDNPDGQDRK